jgi:hypothetical protein
MNYSQSYPNTWHNRRRASKLAPTDIFPRTTVAIAICIVITGFILLIINL